MTPGSDMPAMGGRRTGKFLFLRFRYKPQLDTYISAAAETPTPPLCWKFWIVTQFIPKLTSVNENHPDFPTSPSLLSIYCRANLASDFQMSKSCSD